MDDNVESSQSTEKNQGEKTMKDSVSRLSSGESINPNKENQDQFVQAHQLLEDHSKDEGDGINSMNINELLKALKKTSKEEDVKKISRTLNDLKRRFDTLYNESKKGALTKFLEDKETEEHDFEYRNTQEEEDFINLFMILKSKRNIFFSNLDGKRKENYSRKEKLLERLRELVDSEETNQILKEIRTIQDEWKNIGSVPSTHSRTIWANYVALLDRYYDKQSIYYELKELDRKKNLKNKLELCEKADQLLEGSDVFDMLSKLDGLHEQYKNIGPVPISEQEKLWERFKKATNSIHQKRNKHFQKIKKIQEKNHAKKKKFSIEVKAIAEFDSELILEWNNKTKIILGIKKQWEEMRGGMPKNASKEVNSLFWNSFRTFFQNKRIFQEKLDIQRESNLKEKEEIISKAEALKESEAWQETTTAFIKLQEDWKKIGSASKRFNEEVYQRFRKICDHFFNRKKRYFDEQEKTYQENLSKKKAFCERLKLLIDTKKELKKEEVYVLIDEYQSIGFVPKKSIHPALIKFKSTMDELIDKKIAGEQEKNQLRNYIFMNIIRLSLGGEEMVIKRERIIKKKIAVLSKDVSIWNTNIDFFGRTKSAEKLKKDFQRKIDIANEEISSLRKELKQLKTIE